MKAVTRLLLVVSAAQFAVSGVSAQLAEEYRMWTNTSGKQVEATLVSVDAVTKTLKIKMKDGREFDVAIATLSPADFEYAKARYAAMQAAPAAAPPAMTPAGTPVPAPTTAEAPAAPKGKAAPVVKKPAPPRPALTITPAAKFKAPAGNDYLAGIQKVRPRLVHNKTTWDYLKGQVAADPVLGKVMEALKASGEDLLQDPGLTRINGEDGGEGPKAIYRMGLLGALHYGDGDLKWQDKGKQELLSLTDKSIFRDWHPDLMDNVADLVIATCLGYDWFNTALNAQEKLTVRTYLAEKGVDALIAHLEGEPVPETAKGMSGGQSAPPKAKGPPKKAPSKDDGKTPPDGMQMAAASALLVAAICFVDDDPAMAKKAADTASKVFGRGLERFAPAGVWPEGLPAGEAVMDYIALVVQSRKAAAGNDLGISLVEGIPQFGVARMHLLGPSGQIFNFGDLPRSSRGSASLRPWVATWLCGVHGNPGIPAIAAAGKQAVSSSYFGQVGNFLYYNPHAAGDGTADSMDFALPGGFVATSRSGWGKDDYYIAVKGGDNADHTAQLDIGSFVLEAGGQRWGIELGGEAEEAPGFEVKPGADRTKRFEIYLEGTAGQNTLTVDGNQDLEAKAGVLLGTSDPAKGLAVVDMTKAYSRWAKDVHRGIMVVRSAKPYAVIQDDLAMKNSNTLTWSMHTKAEIAASGASATLNQGGKKLVATIISPAGATFTAGTPPVPEKPANARSRDLAAEKINVLKVALADAKGPQSLCITFALDEAAAHTATPVAEWGAKKK
ncbi:MAG: heparinase II/III domain-containing protein [Prosthecobacter sp.]